jgi:hypothetical protein
VLEHVQITTNEEYSKLLELFPEVDFRSEAPYLPIVMVVDQGARRGSYERDMTYISSSSDDITQDVLNGTYNKFNWFGLIQFTGIGNWDKPMPGKAVVIVDDEDVRKLLIKYKIITENERDLTRPYTTSKWVTTQHSNKYDAYKFVDTALYGAKLWQGEYSWTQLKVFHFASSRIDDTKSLNSFMEELNHVNNVYDENDFSIVEKLSEGYENTPIESCMQGEGNFFLNFDDSGILLEYEHKDMVGRAIVWSDQYLEGLPEGCQGFMDRIYPSGNHKIVRVYKEYAEKHNLLCKTHQTYDEKTTFDWRGEIVRLNLKLSPPNYMANQRYPYMDTLSWTNYNFSEFSNDYTFSDTKLDSTNGGTSESTYCCCCDCCLDEDDGYNVDGDMYCPDCYWERFTECVRCSTTIPSDEVMTVDGEPMCPRCISAGGYVLCEDTNEYAKTPYQAVDTGNYFESDDALYKASDTGEYYEDKGFLFYTEDTHKYFAYDRGLTQASDTELWYEDSDELCYTVDTCNYFASSKYLFVKDGSLYEENQDG